jgi:AraC-like DNA-binding protein
VLNTVSSVVQLLSTVQQAAAGLRKSVRVGHAFNNSAPHKQADINAPSSGTVWQDEGMTRRKTDQQRRGILAEAERVIQERHGEFDLSLTDIAQDVGCSTRQLQRVLREVGGTDFRTQLLEVRMNHAQRLLSRKKDGFSIRAAARQVGYREASGLRQAFVRHFGANPSDVRSPDLDYDELWKAVEQARSP